LIDVMRAFTRIVERRSFNTVALLLQIGEEIDDFQQWEGQRRVIHVFLPDKVYLPVSPFDSRQPISDVGRKSFAVGVLVFAQEEIQLIDTVNRVILRNLRSTHTGKGRDRDGVID
jgi:hypothetical protein